MKKSLPIIIFATIGLSGCSTYHSTMDSIFNSYDSNAAAVQVNSDTDTVDNPDQANTNEPIEVPNASIELKYNQQKHELVAKITTNWNSAPQGSVYLSWITPKDTSCYNTSFPIAKFNETNDLTTDYESVLYNESVCTGKWEAQVINKSDASIIASSTIKISQ